VVGRLQDVRARTAEPDLAADRAGSHEAWLGHKRGSEFAVDAMLPIVN